MDLSDGEWRHTYQCVVLDKWEKTCNGWRLTSSWLSELEKKRVALTVREEASLDETTSGVVNVSITSIVGTMIPRATGSLPIQSSLPTKHPHTHLLTILCFKPGREKRRRRRGALERDDESLNRPEEGHTGAMAIP
ncbi:unnamed protein product [Pleuronectes platessa]|uniref:Uncharacterized protein n=1 Tax=Pleuronectes platessa TaxID=8262 RepID=A0A9N7VV01_PLEPL|nr:unnamed protein product [Pleuronectes platessa]